MTESLAGRPVFPSARQYTLMTFSTAGVPVSRRMELWDRYNARAMVHTTCRTLGEALQATEHNVRTPRLRLAHITAAPHIAERTAREIERHPTGTVLLTVPLAGETCAYYREGVVTLRPGQALLSDTDTPSLRAFAQGLDQLALTVPKTVYRELVGPDLPRPYKVFDLATGAGRSGPGAALAKLMDDTVRGGPVDTDGLEQRVLALLRTMVGRRSADDAGSQLAAAEAYICQHLADPTLSAARVAGALGVSERQVSRIFSRHGGVAHWVTDRRLDLALRLLTSPGRRSVGQVAQECGFGSHSYFARVFRRRFGSSPRDVLHGRGAGPAADATTTDDGVPDLTD
ncbi:MAG TPA: helix-turn-helix domain-containing protein [Streptomyces sp.]|uniref:helix-turn-helix domain-containing protein n=1 Tax=Streptomyces sp. TaxID=1931 RepID=UPI002B903CBA|nr:helix-turn-helix domain-containing protein [Streptomyces sp.]HWU11839.1 helix-turn-helix domain-containing protein [Streptomyces sp.]